MYYNIYKMYYYIMYNTMKGDILHKEYFYFCHEVHVSHKTSVILLTSDL